MVYSQGKKEIKKKTFPGKVQTLDLVNKDFELTVLNMFEQLKETTNKDLKQKRRKMSHQIENVNKKIEIIKKCQKKF